MSQQSKALKGKRPPSAGEGSASAEASTKRIATTPGRTLQKSSKSTAPEGRPTERTSSSSSSSSSAEAEADMMITRPENVEGAPARAPPCSSPVTPKRPHSALKVIAATAPSTPPPRPLGSPVAQTPPTHDGMASPALNRQRSDCEDELESEAEGETALENTSLTAQLRDALVQLAEQATTAVPLEELRELRDRIATFTTREDIENEPCVVLPLGNNGLGKSFLISCLSEMTSIDDATYRRLSRKYFVEPENFQDLRTDELECVREIDPSSLVRWTNVPPTDSAREQKRRTSLVEYAETGRLRHKFPYLYPSNNGMESTTSYITESVYSGIFHCAVTYYSLEELRDFVTLYHTYQRSSEDDSNEREALFARLANIFGDRIPNDASQVTEESVPHEMRRWLGKTRWFCGNGRSVEHDRTRCRDIQQLLLSYGSESNDFGICRALIKINRIGQPAEFLQGGVKYFDVPGMNDDDPIKKHSIHEAVQQSDVLVITHERTLAQAKNIQDALKDPEFGAEFFNAFRKGERTIMFLMMREKGDHRSIEDWFEDDFLSVERSEFEKSVEPIRQQFWQAFQARWPDISDDELRALIDRIVVDYCRPLLHLSSLLNEEAVLAAKSEHGANRVDELLDFVGAHGVLGLPVRLKLQQLHEQYRDISTAISRQQQRLVMQELQGTTSQELELRDEDRAALHQHLHTLAKGKKSQQQEARRTFRAALSDIPNLKNDARYWAGTVADGAIQHLDIDAITAKVKEWFRTKAESLNLRSLRQALNPTFKLNHKEMPLQTFAAAEVVERLFDEGAPLNFHTLPERLCRELEGPVLKHFNDLMLHTMTPPQLMPTQTRSATRAVVHSPVQRWLQHQLAKQTRQIRSVLESTATQQLHTRRKLCNQISKKLAEHLAVMGERHALNSAVASNSSNQELMEVTDRVIDAWLHTEHFSNLLTDFLMDMLIQYVDNVYAALVAGISKEHKTAKQLFMEDKKNKKRVREELGRKRVLKETMHECLRRLWEEATFQEKQQYREKEERQNVKRGTTSKPSALSKLGLEVVKEMLKLCADDKRDHLRPVDNRLDFQRASTLLQDMLQLLERTNLTADACNQFVQSTARAMCYKYIMVALQNRLLTEHPQLDFSMTYKTSAYRECIERIVDVGEYLSMAEISQRLDWRPFDDTRQATAVWQNHSFRRKPTQKTGVDSLLANALHQLKGAYNEGDVIGLREYLKRWVKAHYLHDAEFRAEAQRHVLHNGCSVDDFVRQIDASPCPHPFLLECLCKMVNVGFLVWSKHDKPVLFGHLKKRDKIFNLLCVKSSSSPEALTFDSLVVRRYVDDIRLEGNPAPAGTMNEANPVPSVSTTDAAPSTPPDEGRSTRRRHS